MNWSLNSAAVIPCLNEEKKIPEVVCAVRKCLPTIVVVDDGSQDRTGSKAREAGAEVFRNERSLGKGAALQRGWRHLHERGFKWALSLDGDGQHSAEDIPKFFECAERTSALLVLGNRMPEAEKMPFVRRFVNRWMSRRLSKLTGRDLPDSQCGFRLMNLDAWSELPITATHFQIESEVVVAFVTAGHSVEFVPIRVIYKGEQSKIHPLRDTVRWFRWWAKWDRGETRQRLNGTNKSKRCKS